MLHAEEKEKHLGAELRQLYDPSVNSPRRSELKKKLRVRFSPRLARMIVFLCCCGAIIVIIHCRDQLLIVT